MSYHRKPVVNLWPGQHLTSANPPGEIPRDGTYTVGWIEDGEGGVAPIGGAGMSDMVERVAKATYEVRPWIGVDWGALPSSAKFEYLAKARAAIDVVLEEAATLTDLGGDIALHKLEDALK